MNEDKGFKALSEKKYLYIFSSFEELDCY